MKADTAVFSAVVIGSAFVFGLGIGQDRARDHLASTCLEQPGERLLSSYQHRDGVVCSYGPGYGAATKKRKATS